jgi:hypothetical protein
MKMINSLKLLLLTFGLLTLMGACGSDDEPDVIPEPTTLRVEEFVTGLNHPIGGSIDSKGNLWVTDAGTGNNDASVVMINPAGEKTTFVEGLPSILANGSIEGISHPLIQGNTLFFLHGISGMLYKADVSSFAKGSAAVALTSLPSEDVKTYINSQNLVDPVNSNAYDLAVGPDNDIFFTDAGSNAVIRRKNDGTLSVFAKIPNIADQTEAVPTGITYDGDKLIVTCLTGFPFAAGAAKIFKVDKSGVVSEYKTGLTLLSSVALTVGNKPLVTQLGIFGAGFGATDGKVLDESGKVLAEGFGMPTDIIRKDDRSFYVVNYLSGKIDLLTY